MHWKALSATATLEVEIEGLHQIRCHSQLEVRHKSQHHWSSERMQEGRCTVRLVLQANPPPAKSTDPDMSHGKTEPEEQNF